MDGAWPYLILDARYEKVREDGVIRSQAVLEAIGIDLEGPAPGPVVEPAPPLEPDERRQKSRLA